MDHVLVIEVKSEQLEMCDKQIDITISKERRSHKQLRLSSTLCVLETVHVEMRPYVREQARS